MQQFEAIPEFKEPYAYFNAMLEQGKFAGNQLASICSMLGREGEQAQKEKRVSRSAMLLDCIVSLADKAVAQGHADQVLPLLTKEFDFYRIRRNVPAAAKTLKALRPRYLAAWADKDPAAAVAFDLKQHETSLQEACYVNNHPYNIGKPQAARLLSAYAVTISGHRLPDAVAFACHALSEQQRSPAHDELMINASQLIGKLADDNLETAAAKLKTDVARFAKPTDTSWPAVEQTALEIADRMAGEIGEAASARYLLNLLNHPNRRNRVLPETLVKTAQTSLDRLALADPVTASRITIHALHEIALNMQSQDQLERSGYNYVRSIPFDPESGIPPVTRLSLSYKLAKVTVGDSPILEPLERDITKLQFYSGLQRPGSKKKAVARQPS